MSTFTLTWAASLHFAAAVVVLITLLLSLRRVFRGPTPVERILAAQLMGTAGVAVLLLVESGLARSGLATTGFLDVALVFAVLAGVAGVAFVRRGWEGSGGNHGEEDGHGPAA